MTNAPNIDEPSAAPICGDCQSFANGWMGRDWRCRRGGCNVNANSGGCHKWHARKPEPEPDVEAMRATAALLDNFTKSLKIRLEVVEIKPRERPPGLRGSTDGVVYFLDCGPLTKVGHTSQLVGDRIKGIETHNPFDLTLWGLVPGNVAFEREWHSHLSSYRYRNEWFLLSAEIREDAKRLIVDQGGELYE